MEPLLGQWNTFLTANTACKRCVTERHFQANHCHSPFVNVTFFTTISLTLRHESTYTRASLRHCPWGEEWFHVGGWLFRLRECTFLTWQNGPPSMISEVLAVYLPGKVMCWGFRMRGESISVCLQCRMSLFRLAGVVSSVGCCMWGCQTRYMTTSSKLILI